jgi:putative ABC transport system ATP-binding protein
VIESKTILDVNNVRREFHMEAETIYALRNISFSVRKGEFVTIMGPSGCGKSTLLNILGCLDKPSHGEYILDGEPTHKLKRDALSNIRKRKIGFVFQNYELLQRTNALEQVELPLLYNSAISVKKRKEYAMACLERVGLANRHAHLPNQLSGGQKQRVAIARALVNDPVMILADEPTGALDERTGYEIIDLLQELNRQKKTIVFVTHNPEITTFSGRTIKLKDGILLSDSKNENIASASQSLANLPVPPENEG